MTRPILLLALCLTACSTDPTSFWYMPPPTPAENCTFGGGDWQTVTTYDTTGTPDVVQQCVQRD